MLNIVIAAALMLLLGAPQTPAPPASGGQAAAVKAACCAKESKACTCECCKTDADGKMECCRRHNGSAPSKDAKACGTDCEACKANTDGEKCCGEAAKDAAHACCTRPKK